MTLSLSVCICESLPVEWVCVCESWVLWICFFKFVVLSLCLWVCACWMSPFMSLVFCEWVCFLWVCHYKSLFVSLYFWVLCLSPYFLSYVFMFMSESAFVCKTRLVNLRLWVLCLCYFVLWSARAWKGTVHNIIIKQTGNDDDTIIFIIIKSIHNDAAATS